MNTDQATSLQKRFGAPYSTARQDEIQINVYEYPNGACRIIATRFDYIVLKTRGYAYALRRLQTMQVEE